MLRYGLSLPALLALRGLRRVRPCPEGFRILMFHDVPRKHFGDFRRFVEYVKQTHGVLSPEEAAAVISGEASLDAPGRTPCLFTFDDGFASNFELAGEVLGRCSIKALFFVCPGLVGLSAQKQQQNIATNIFDGAEGAESRAAKLRLMNWNEIGELVSMGHTIGAHGVSHQRLTELKGSKLHQEILDSGSRLEDRLGRDIDWYAYAFGDINSISAEALKIVSQKYRFCRSGVRGVNVGKTDPYALRSEHVDMAAPSFYRKLTVEGGLDRRYGGARKLLDKMASF